VCGGKHPHLKKSPRLHHSNSLDLFVCHMYKPPKLEPQTHGAGRRERRHEHPHTPSLSPSSRTTQTKGRPENNAKNKQTKPPNLKTLLSRFSFLLLSFFPFYPFFWFLSQSSVLSTQCSTRFRVPRNGRFQTQDEQTKKRILQGSTHENTTHTTHTNRHPCADDTLIEFNDKIQDRNNNNKKKKNNQQTHYTGPFTFSTTL